MKNKIFNFITKVTAVATIASSFYMVSPVKAANFTTMSDTMTRLANGQTADHTIVLTLPNSVDFDSDTGTDVLAYDFDTNDFTLGGTWTTADFTFNDGTTRTVDAVNAGDGAATVSCTDGANNVGVAIDTNAAVGTFRVIPCGPTFTASATGATVTFTIDGTAGNGTLTNIAVGSSQLAITMDDNGASSAHSGDIYVIIVDSDQVTVTADVNPTMTFDLDVSIATGGQSTSTYTVALGTLSTGSVSTSGDGTINMIGVDLDANATGGTVVTVRSAFSDGMRSTSTPADYIDMGSTTFVAGTEAYGICVHRVAATSGTLQTANFDNDNLSASSSFADSTSCTNSTHVTTDALTSAPQTILNTSSAPISGGRAEIFVKAAISATTPAHDDYTDTLTFVATGTF